MATTDAEQRVTRRVVEVTADLHGITAEVERRRLASPDPDPRLLAILTTMEARIERAVQEAADELRQLDDQEARLS